MYLGGLLVNGVIYQWNVLDSALFAQTLDSFHAALEAADRRGSGNMSQLQHVPKFVREVVGSQLAMPFTFENWNVFTVIDCANKACLGLVLGYVMRYLGNLHKLFMFGCSMFCSAGLGILARVAFPERKEVHTKRNQEVVSGQLIRRSSTA